MATILIVIISIVFSWIITYLDSYNSDIVVLVSSYDYFGFKTLERSYLMKLNGNIASIFDSVSLRSSIVCLSNSKAFGYVDAIDRLI